MVAFHQMMEIPLDEVPHNQLKPHEHPDWMIYNVTKHHNTQKKYLLPIYCTLVCLSTQRTLYIPRYFLLRPNT